MLAKTGITHLMTTLGPYPPPSFYVTISAALDIILCAFLNLICALSFLSFQTSYLHFLGCIFKVLSVFFFNVSKSHKK